MVANLPYYITTPIIMGLFESHVPIDSITIMVQKEVAERICARPGTAAYGALSAQMQIMGNVRITRLVPRHLFYPAPEVDSAVVRLDVAPQIARAALPAYRKAVSAAFAMRRKTLCNNITAAYGISKKAAEQAVETVCGNKSARGETLSPAQFVRLSELLE